MIIVKRYTHLVILGTKHPRIWVPPTQFQNFNQNSKIEFPGNLAKIFISPESEFSTESFPVFWNKKIARRKKLWRFQAPEFNLSMTLLKPLLQSSTRRKTKQRKLLFWANSFGIILKLRILSSPWRFLLRRIIKQLLASGWDSQLER